MQLWHPWRWLRDHHPDVDVVHVCLAGDRMAETRGRVLSMDARLTQAERRCTLTHEIVHIERRGHEHVDPDVEERIVELETARRLITPLQLVDAFRWLRHPNLHDLADHLWVDQQTALCRMENLEPSEIAAIDVACDGEWSWRRVDITSDTIADPSGRSAPSPEGPSIP